MKRLLLFGLILFLMTLIGCGEAPYTGIKFKGNQIIEAGESTTITAEYILEDEVIPSEKITFILDNDTTGGAEPTEIENNSITIKTGSTKAGFVKLTATSKSCSNSIWICTNADSVICPSDRPNGFASVEAASNFGGYNPNSTEKVVTVTNSKDLKNYASKGGYVIYVDGMIDMTDGMLPKVGGGSTEKLDEFVASKTNYKNYAEWKNNFSSCSVAEDKKDSTLASAWKKQIQVNIKSNTTIIGLYKNAGIKGCALSISNVKNIAIRNLTLQDCYDPFPNHEKNDGWNAQYDLIGIQESSSNIWIDHCTLEDTMTLGKAANGEKWQTYDGLLDMKKDTRKVTISYCIFRDHDKTMLIGSSDSDGNSATRTITIHHNYWNNCGQRQPMARNVSLHLYNNLYEYSGGKYSQQSVCDVRAGSLIMTEKNPGIAFSSYVGKQIEKKDSSENFNILFNIPYAYAAEEEAVVKSNLKNIVGAGKLLVIKD